MAEKTTISCGVRRISRQVGARFSGASGRRRRSPSFLRRMVYGCVIPWMLVHEAAADEASRDEQLSARRELASIGVDFTPESLLRAIDQNDRLVVTLLIEGGLDVNLPDKEGRVALVEAAYRADGQLVERVPMSTPIARPA